MLKEIMISGGMISEHEDVGQMEKLFFEFLEKNNIYFGGCIGQRKDMPDVNEYVSGLKRAIEVIKIEQEYAKKVNTQMCLGMEQAIKMIEKEIKNELK